MARITKICLRLAPPALIIAFVFSIVGPSATYAAPAWYNSSWLYRKQITILGNQVTGTLTNFPILMSIPFDSDLAANARPDGNDIIFTDANQQKLYSEIEQYVSATGKLVAWIQIPSLTHNVNTNIFMYYGNAAAAPPIDEALVWDSHYVVVQHLEETVNGAVNDSTSYNNNGTDMNLPAFGATGQVNGAISFDGADDYITFGYGNGVNITRPLTIEVWIKPNSVPAGNSSEPIVFRDDGMRMNYSLSIASGTYTGGSGVKVLFWREDAADTDNKTYGTTEISAGIWYRIVIVDAGPQGAPGNFSIYVNGGAPEGVRSCSMTAFDDATYKLTVADTNGERIGGGGYFNGMIDEVRISNSVRSADWIKTSYDNQNNPSAFFSFAPLAQGQPVIGGKVFSVNKAAVLAPWIILGAALLIISIRIVIHFRKRTPSQPKMEKNL